MADKKISALTASTTPLAGTEVLPIVQGGATVKVSAANITAGRAVSALSYSATNGYQFRATDNTSYELLRVLDGTVNPGAFIKARAATTDVTLFASGSSVVGQRLMIGAESVEDVVRVSKDNVTVSYGNLVIGTAAKGIDFSANTGTAGMTSELLNWYEEGTFIPTLSGATTTTYTTQTGRYTRIGRQIFFECELEINSVGNGSTTIVLLGALPTALGSPFSTISVGFFTGIASTVSSLTGYIGAAGANSVQFQSLLVAATATAPNAVFANGARVMFSGQYSV